MATNSINIGSNVIGSVTITGTPSAGNVIIATDANDGYWGPLNSSGGSITLAGAVTGPSNANLISLTGNSSITGVLPAANQAAQTMGGDVAGTTAASTVTLAGDVTGRAGSTVLAAIDGYAVPNPGNHTGVFQSSGSALTFGTVATSNITAGTANQVLINNATPVPTWTTLSGDVSNVLGAMSVKSLTGNSGTINIASTGNIFTWAAATTAPGLAQTAAVSGAGANMTLAPQAATTTGTSGSLVVNLAVPASGTTEAAFVLQRAGSNLMQFQGLVGNPTSFWAFYSGGVTPNNANYAFAGTMNGATLYLSPSTALEISTGTVNWNVNNGTNYFNTTIAAAYTNIYTVNTTSVSTSHAAKASGTGAAMSITAQPSNVATAGIGGSLTLSAGDGYTTAGGTGTGGNLILNAGNGISASGQVNIQLASSTVESFTATQGTHNSQTNRVDQFFGNCETISSASATQIATYTTTTGTGGLITMIVTSRATTAGSGVTADDFGAATYVLVFRNHGGTVALSTAGITLVGSSQTTNATFTAPVLTTTIATNVITIKVTNVALCTVDSQIDCTVTVC